MLVRVSIGSERVFGSRHMRIFKAEWLYLGSKVRVPLLWNIDKSPLLLLKDWPIT